MPASRSILARLNVGYTCSPVKDSRKQGDARASIGNPGSGCGPGRVVVMDVGLTYSRFHRLLAPLGRLLEKLGPGDAFSEPWDGLAAYGEVETEFFMAGFYYVSAVDKQQGSAQRRLS
jgi:hypothetical protein